MGQGQIVMGIDYATADGDQVTAIFAQYDQGVATVVGELRGPAAAYVASLKADVDALLAFKDEAMILFQNEPPDDLGAFTRLHRKQWCARRDAMFAALPEHLRS